ncbi:hypothetical protein FA322_08790 [Pseudomonas aeruginosa]|nr:hypothetical protein [Pseudomonas aeruginosa]
MTDINRLKVLAERAEALYGAPSLEHVFAITKFREAVEPKAILGLIAEVERIKAENEALRIHLKALIRISDATGWEDHTCGEIAKARAALEGAKP